jgi:hypothetical protein
MTPRTTTRRHQVAVANPGAFRLPAMLVVVVGIIVMLVAPAEGGIAGFQKWLKSSFPEAVVDIPAGQRDVFDVVCLDMNQVLHSALRKASDEPHAIRRVFKEVNRILRTCNPRLAVVFAFDGVAPMAKLMTQRRRRESSKRDGKYKMSPLHLTPGTEFMRGAAEAMRHYASTKLLDSRYKEVRFYISGADIPGEGEIKVFDWIKRSELLPDGTDRSVVLIGGDADLVLQGLVLTKVKNLFTFMTGVNGNGTLVSMWMIVRALEQTWLGSSDRVRTDLIFLLTSCGNDYIPRVRGITFDRCFKAYNAARRKWVEAGMGDSAYVIDGLHRTFNWPFALDFFQELYELASDIPRAAQVVRIVAKTPPSIGEFFNTILIQPEGLTKAMETEFHADAKYPHWTAVLTLKNQSFHSGPGHAGQKAAIQEAHRRALQTLSPEGYRNYLKALRKHGERVKELEEEGFFEDGGVDEGSLSDPGFFLQGLLWNIQMYEDGFCPDFWFMYDLPYAPSCCDLLEWIKQAAKESVRLEPPTSTEPPLHCDVACLTLMNVRGRGLVPPGLRDLMDIGSPVMHLYKEDSPSVFDVKALLEAVNNHPHWEKREIDMGRAWTVVQRKDSKSAKDKKSRSGARRISMPPPLISHLQDVDVRSIEYLILGATDSPPCHPWSRPGLPMDLRPSPQSIDQVLAVPHFEPFGKYSKGHRSGLPEQGSRSKRRFGGASLQHTTAKRPQRGGPPAVPRSRGGPSRSPSIM